MRPRQPPPEPARRTPPPGYLCGLCAGRQVLWCPDCCGYTGCTTCDQTCTVLCPCAGGTNTDRIRW